MRRLLVPAVAAALIAGAIVPATGAAAPCAPGTSLTPTITLKDPLDSSVDRTLTATHPIVALAEWPTGGSAFADDLTAQWSAPAGVPVFTERSRGGKQLDLGPGSAAFQPASAGPLPVTVTWEQSDSNSGARCTGSYTTTLQIAAARALNPKRPRVSTEFTWEIPVGRNANRAPVEVRFRAVRGAHLPGSRVRFQSAKYVLRPTDPASAGGIRRRVLHGPTAKLAVELSEPAELDLTFSVIHRTTNPKLGYEIQILQGGRRIARLRAALRCNAFLCPASPLRFGR